MMACLKLFVKILASCKVIRKGHISCNDKNLKNGGKSTAKRKATSKDGGISKDKGKSDSKRKVSS